MFYSYVDSGTEFHLLSFQHFMGIFLFLVVPLSLVLFFKEKIKASPSEKVIRYTIVAIGMLAEFNLYAWYLLNGVRDVLQIIPTTLCGFTLYLSAYCMLTLDKKLSPMMYYFIFGAILSFSVADITHGYDRIRFYLFFMVHGAILVNTLYLNVIHNLKPTKEAMYRGMKILLVVLVIAYGFSHIFHHDFFYLYEPPFEDFPIYQALYDVGRIWYALAVAISYYILIYLLELIRILVSRLKVKN